MSAPTVMLEPLTARPVGRALLVHARESTPQRAAELAAALATDPASHPVVLDLPGRLAGGLREALAVLLVRELPEETGRAVLLVPGRGTAADIGATARWLADRLDRAVIAPEGRRVLVAGGALFISIADGAGWLRYRSGRRAERHSRRFPRPDWDELVPDRPWAVRPGCAAEPVAAGLWLRPCGVAEPETHRARLNRQFAVDPSTPALVLGAPGSRELTAGEVAEFVGTLCVAFRLHRYGPVADGFGPALATLLGRPVVLDSETFEPVAPAAPESPVGSPTPPRPRLESAPVDPPDPEQPAPAARQPRRDGLGRQPVPAAAAGVAVAAGQDLAGERRWLREVLKQRYDDSIGVVERLVAQSPGLSGVNTVPDLVAAYVYLTSGSARAVDHAVRGGTVGAHVPLARCVASGLGRLPSYRGVTLLRAALTEADLDVYRQTPELTEWACCSALAYANGLPELPSGTDILVWSLTARRTATLDPAVPQRVVFLPGTTFRVLRVISDGERPAVLLRESALSGAAERLDRAALDVLTKARDLRGTAEPGPPLPAAYRWDFAAPPGLLTPAPPGGERA